jgi:hypothetical protein
MATSNNTLTLNRHYEWTMRVFPEPLRINVLLVRMESFQLSSIVLYLTESASLQ